MNQSYNMNTSITQNNTINYSTHSYFFCFRKFPPPPPSLLHPWLTPTTTAYFYQDFIIFTIFPQLEKFSILNAHVEEPKLFQRPMKAEMVFSPNAISPKVISPNVFGHFA